MGRKGSDDDIVLMLEPDGTVQTLYTEAIDLRKFGKLNIQRASHVDADRKGMWWANLSPVKGPRLGPFRLRSQALKAEVAWIKKHVLK